MQKIKMSRGVSLTFEEGCRKYLENCRQRNLREGTINHYRQSYLYFYKYFDPKMPIEDIDEQAYKDYVIHLKKVLHNDTGISVGFTPTFIIEPKNRTHHKRISAYDVPDFFISNS